jgi:hypothetical protein
MVCERCGSDDVTTFRKRNLYTKWLFFKKYTSAEFVYLCNRCQAAMVLIHIDDDYSRHGGMYRHTGHYPSTHVMYTKEFVEEAKGWGHSGDGFADYISRGMANFSRLEQTPINEYRINHLIFHCSVSSVGECILDPKVCERHGIAARRKMEKSCNLKEGEGFTYTTCPKLIKQRLFVELNGHELLIREEVEE